MKSKLIKSIYLRSDRLGHKLAPAWPSFNVLGEYYISSELYIQYSKNGYEVFGQVNNRLYRLI